MHLSSLCTPPRKNVLQYSCFHADLLTCVALCLLATNGTSVKTGMTEWKSEEEMRGGRGVLVFFFSLPSSSVTVWVSEWECECARVCVCVMVKGRAARGGGVNTWRRGRGKHQVSGGCVFVCVNVCVSRERCFWPLVCLPRLRWPGCTRPSSGSLFIPCSFTML